MVLHARKPHLAPGPRHFCARAQPATPARGRPMMNATRSVSVSCVHNVLMARMVEATVARLDIFALLHAGSPMSPHAPISPHLCRRRVQRAILVHQIRHALLLVGAIAQKTTALVHHFSKLFKICWKTSKVLLIVYYFDAIWIIKNCFCNLFSQPRSVRQWRLRRREVSICGRRHLFGNYWLLNADTRVDLRAENGIDSHPASFDTSAKWKSHTCTAGAGDRRRSGKNSKYNRIFRFPSAKIGIFLQKWNFAKLNFDFVLGWEGSDSVCAISCTNDEYLQKTGCDKAGQVCRQAYPIPSDTYGLVAPKYCLPKAIAGTISSPYSRSFCKRPYDCEDDSQYCGLDSTCGLPPGSDCLSATEGRCASTYCVDSKCSDLGWRKIQLIV